MTHRTTAARSRTSECIFWAISFFTLPALAPADSPEALNRAGEPQSLESMIQGLSSDSYVTRQMATDRILAIGPRAIGPLQAAMSDPSLDVRSQAKLIVRKIHDEDVERTLQRLLAPDGENDGDALRLPMWTSLSTYLGDDRNARRIYGELSNRYRESMTALSGDQQCHYRLPSPSRLDPQKLDRSELLGWMMVLLVDLSVDQAPLLASTESSQHLKSKPLPALNQTTRYASLSTRLAATLNHPKRCPDLVLEGKAYGDLEREALRRLISAWVSSDHRLVCPQDRLAIAMRYDCLEQARELCTAVLSRQSSEPRSVAMALLAAATLDHPELTDYLDKFAFDRRVAHHFQLVGIPAVFVNTQVRDVVLALRLRQHGLDPRDAGFVQLQADPTYVYRPISLGFSCDSQRNRCHDDAALIIQSR